MDLMDFDATGLGVLVGVDGSTGAAVAIGFAAAEAGLRHRPLTVCQVRPAGHGQDVTATTAVLDDAVAHLARVAPGVTVRPLAEFGHPAQVLATLAADAELTVVGSRGRGGVAGLMLGSVGLHLATRTPGPVVVVRPAPPDTDAGTFAGHVVVGVDGSPASTAALDFGFAEADRRGCPLAAVHVHRSGPVDTYVDDRTLELHAEVRQAGRDLLDTAVELWTVRYPRVAVKRVLHHGSPAAGLLRAAGGAVLIAVGRTGRSAAAGMVFGSVSQAVVHRAPCPVAVIPTEAPLRR